MAQGTANVMVFVIDTSNANGVLLLTANSPLQACWCRPLPHYPRDTARFVRGARDVVLEIANRRCADIARTYVGPGATTYFALAGELTALAGRIGRHLNLPVVPAETVNAELDHAAARFDHTSPAHA